MPNEKLCTACKVAKPISEFGKRPGARGPRPISRCKKCDSSRTSAYGRKAYASTKAFNERKRQLAASKIPEGYKKCSGCAEVLAVACFGLKKRSGVYKQRTRCIACTALDRDIYKVIYEQELKAKAAMRRAVNKEELAARQRRWREENPARYREIHATWKRRNRDACASARHRRRLKRDAAVGSYTAKEWQELKVKCDYYCLMCYQQEPHIVLTVDHIVPIHLGGSNDIDNIQPLCKSCNSKKHINIIDLRPMLEVS